MKKLLGLAFLGLLCASFAHAGENKKEAARDSVVNTTSLCSPHWQEDALALLKKQDHHGYRLYLKVKELNDEDSFTFFMSCKSDPDSQIMFHGLSTAVHETAHHVSWSTEKPSEEAYYLPDGSIKSLPQKNFFTRNEIVPYLSKKDLDDYYNEYLAGEPGLQPFPTLLNELNAYTTELQTMRLLVSDTPMLNLVHYVDHNGGINLISYTYRDGVARMMHYTALSLKHMSLKRKEAWKDLISDKGYSELIAALWLNAEAGLRATCQTKGLGINDRAILNAVYSEDPISYVRKFFKAIGQSSLKIELPKECQASESMTPSDPAPQPLLIDGGSIESSIESNPPHQ